MKDEEANFARAKIKLGQGFFIYSLIITNRFEISKFEALSIFDLLRTLERSTKTFLIHVKNDTKFITNRKLKIIFLRL